MQQNSNARDLVSADVNESPHAVATGGFKHDVRAQNICLRELEAIAERVVHM